MAITYIKTKSGEECSGPIKLFRPAFNFLTLFNYPNRKFSFDECESIITKGERVSINSPLEGEDQDEFIRAKKNLDWGRLNGWTETDENGIEVPYSEEKFEWEKRYE